jgi:hypothetical protein
VEESLSLMKKIDWTNYINALGMTHRPTILPSS